MNILKILKLFSRKDDMPIGLSSINFETEKTYIKSPTIRQKISQWEIEKSYMETKIGKLYSIDQIRDSRL